MVGWAADYLGSEEFASVLINGYNSFVLDVGKSQMEYEKRGAYKNKTYAEVYQSVYNNADHMQNYHWGVFTTTFAWEHHLKIAGFFKDYFLPVLPDEGGTLLELGSGSGVWGLLLLHGMQQWTLDGVDISQKSVELAIDMTRRIGFSDRTNYIVGDALAFTGAGQYDAAISCFLLEHVERPDLLFSSLAGNLNPGGYAFVTGALTAAEIDHITEFKRESEIIKLAEDAGFRVVSTYSASPGSYPSDFRFLPRSMALVLQKRRNDIW
ncbi:MAG: class I SAM-dependent methyltransferase [Terrimicrobiaceae bacterium]|nr:class I SAM-dependent methyltransferase [Terrimicrobiaceae bacterium]